MNTRPPVRELLERFELEPSGCKYCEITPEDAKFMLRYNVPNRPLRAHQVKKLARLMRDGMWHYNAENVKFAITGRLLDGQHRLWAIIEARTVLQLDIVTGLPEDVFSSINTDTLARTRSDIVNQHNGKNAVVAASAVSLVLQLYYSHKYARITSVDFEKFYLEYQRMGIHRSAELAAVWYKKNGILSTKIYAGLHFLFSQNGYAGKADEFFNLLSSGEGLQSASPIYLLREFLIKNMSHSTKKTPEKITVAVIIKTWNAYVSDKPMRLVRWSPNAEEFPAIINVRTGD